MKLVHKQIFKRLAKTVKDVDISVHILPEQYKDSFGPTIDQLIDPYFVIMSVVAWRYYNFTK